MGIAGLQQTVKLSERSDFFFLQVLNFTKRLFVVLNMAERLTDLKAIESKRKPFLGAVVRGSEKGGKVRYGTLVGVHVFLSRGVVVSVYNYIKGMT